jgi:hypothetical protein
MMSGPTEINSQRWEIRVTLLCVNTVVELGLLSAEPALLFTGHRKQASSYTNVIVSKYKWHSRTELRAYVP